jgi:hypothetical protein
MPMAEMIKARLEMGHLQPIEIEIAGPAPTSIMYGAPLRIEDLDGPIEATFAKTFRRVRIEGTTLAVYKLV